MNTGIFMLLYNKEKKKKTKKKKDHGCNPLF